MFTLDIQKGGIRFWI
jgi:hypothetical protein